MFEALAQALSAGLTIWQSENKRKYQDDLRKIVEDQREEMAKPIHVRSDARLDELANELRDLSIAISAEMAR